MRLSDGNDTGNAKCNLQNQELQDSEFGTLLSESFRNQRTREGDLVVGRIVRVDPKAVLVDVNLKSEGVVSRSEFGPEEIDRGFHAGDEVEVVIESVANKVGVTVLSHLKARIEKMWSILDRALREETLVPGTVTKKVKGGFEVDLGCISAFLPRSLVSTREVDEIDDVIGSSYEFRVIKVDRNHENIVLSRRVVVDSQNDEKISELLEGLEAGQVRQGVVKNITDYGAFVGLGGLDGLLHITDMAWRRVSTPSQVLKIGQKVDVMILKVNPQERRISLGMKQLTEDPWVGLKDKYPKGSRISGVVTNMTDYGCFVEVVDGIEGLVHISEMDWHRRNVSPSEFVTIGQEVDVVVLEIDQERRRISLGMKQIKENPWEIFAASHRIGEIVNGHVCSITDFGVFLRLESQIDGLIHLADLNTKSLTSEEINDLFPIDSKQSAMLLSANADRERVSLGIKQLANKEFCSFILKYGKNSLIEGKLTSLQNGKAKFLLEEGAEGIFDRNEFSLLRGENLPDDLVIGNSYPLKIVAIYYRPQTIVVSVSLKKDSESEKSNTLDSTDQKEIESSKGD